MCDFFGAGTTCEDRVGISLFYCFLRPDSDAEIVSDEGCPSSDNRPGSGGGAL